MLLLSFIITIVIIIIVIENCRGTYTFTNCIDVLTHSALEFPVDGDSSYITPLHMPITLESLHKRGALNIVYVLRIGKGRPLLIYSIVIINTDKFKVHIFYFNPKFQNRPVKAAAIRKTENWPKCWSEDFLSLTERINGGADSLPLTLIALV